MSAASREQWLAGSLRVKSGNDEKSKRLTCTSALDTKTLTFICCLLLSFLGQRDVTFIYCLCCRCCRCNVSVQEGTGVNRHINNNTMSNDAMLGEEQQLFVRPSTTAVCAGRRLPETMMIVMHEKQPCGVTFIPPLLADVPKFPYVDPSSF